MLARFRLNPRQFRTLLRGYTEWIFSQTAGIPCWTAKDVIHAQVIYVTACRRALGMMQSCPAVVVMHSMGLPDVESLLFHHHSRLLDRWQKLEWTELIGAFGRRHRTMSGGTLDYDKLVELVPLEPNQIEVRIRRHMEDVIARRVNSSTGSLTYFSRINASYPWHPRIARFLTKRGWKEELKRRAGVENQGWYTAWRLQHGIELNH